MLSDEVLSVVFDIGTLYARAGFSGEDAPRYHSVSKVGEGIGAMEAEGHQRKYLVGDEYLMKRREHTEIKDAIHNGYVNLDAYGALVDNCYRQLRVDPKEYSLLIANNFAGKSEREKVCELLFENFKIPNLFTIRNSVLSAFSAGRQSALVIDIGAESTTAMAVHDGYGLIKTSVTLPFGGETLNRLYLRDLVVNHKLDKIPLRYQIQTDFEGRKQILSDENIHPSFNNFHLMELLRDIKEQTIMVSDAQAQTIPQPQQYELPDGQKVEISAKSIDDISETLFGENLDLLQSLAGQNTGTFKGIQHMVVDVLNSSNTDLKTLLSSTILATGGSSAISGLLPRLNRQLSNLVPPMCKIKLIQYPSQQNRQHSVFIGGSILGSLSSFQSMWVTRTEYEEVGYAILERKCPM